MGLPAGETALVGRTKPTEYEEGLYHVAHTVRDMLTLAFFYGRLRGELRGEALSAIDREQSRWSSIACLELAETYIRTLFDSDKRSWSFHQLLKLRKRLAHAREEEREIQDRIDKLEQTFAEDKGSRAASTARGTKAFEMRGHASSPDRVGHLQELLELMDLFVSSPIPYKLPTSTQAVDWDLRELLRLAPGNRKTQPRK